MKRTHKKILYLNVGKNVLQNTFDTDIRFFLQPTNYFTNVTNDECLAAVGIEQYAIAGAGKVL